MIQPRYAALAQVVASQNDAEKKLDGIQTAIKHANTTAIELTNVTQTLSDAENDMASGTFTPGPITPFGCLKPRIRWTFRK